MNKYLIFPDTHGSTYWETVKDKVKDSTFIFIGDYLDSYGDFTREEELNNFKNIIEFKREHAEKVILLVGNHDVNQYLLNEPMSRKAEESIGKQVAELLTTNRNLFQVCCKVGDYVVSHAGITKTWFKKFKFKSIDDINERFAKNDLQSFKWPYYSMDPYGDDVEQSCMWVRPKALLSDLQFPKQIVGHTKLDKFPNSFTSKDLPGVEIYFIDKDLVNRHYLELEA